MSKLAKRIAQVMVYMGLEPMRVAAMSTSYLDDDGLSSSQCSMEPNDINHGG